MIIRDWIILAVLFVASIILTLVRTAIANAHLPHLLNLKESRGKVVDLAIRRVESPRMRISLRIGQVLLHLVMGVQLIRSVTNILVGPDERWTGWILAVVFILLIILEYAVEGWVLRKPEEWAIRAGFLASFIDILLSPISHIAKILSGQSAINRLGTVPPTDDEMRSWVETGQTNGMLEQEERRMIYSIFQFGDRLAREIMVPRIDMLAFDIETDVNEVVRTFISSGHSRVPVYEGTIDNILGLLYAKDMLRSYSPNEKPLRSIRSLIRPAYFIPEAKKLDEVLAEMQSRRVHMAIVVDEYGGVAGLVTLENILEEIFGEIRDEYDAQEELPYRQINENEYLITGSFDLDDLNTLMGTSIPKESADTLGGFLYGELGKVPTGGEEIRVDDIRLVVEKVTDRRIAQVRAIRSIAIPDPNGEVPHAD